MEIKKEEEILTIDGSILEGGGSILRLSTAFSVITGRPIEIINIRKGRAKPGLATQHLVGLQVMAGLFGLQLEGASIGSGSVRICPGKDPSRVYDARIRTAGSVALVFQPVLIASITNERELQVCAKGGGTYGKAAPPVDYLERVYCSTLRQQGIRSAIEISKHGFFPQGGAEVNLEILPVESGALKPLELVDPPNPTVIRGYSVASESLARANVADRQVRAATDYLEKKFPKKVEIDVKSEFVRTDCPGSGITLWIENEQGFSTIGTSDFGARGKSSEVVGKNAARLLVKEFLAGAAMDSHLADQIIPYMACAAATSFQGSRITVSEMTLHSKTNIEISKMFFPGLEIKVVHEDKYYLITCINKRS